MRFNELNKNNYMLFAIKFYDNPQAITEEDFNADLKRIKYVKRLLKKYKNTGILKTHLIINHLIVLFNVFDDAAVPLLFYNLEEYLWPSIKSFLVFLGRIPEYPRTKLNDLEVDQYCLSLLEKL